MSKSIAIASDHAGYELKEVLKNNFAVQGVEVIDLGADSKDSVDYPDYGYKLADEVASNKSDLGIAICGSGVGISIALNRNNKVRAALCHNEEIAKLARQHNDANVLVLGARFVNEEVAKKCVDAFLNAEFEGGRHQRRVEKLGN